MGSLTKNLMTSLILGTDKNVSRKKAASGSPSTHHRPLAGPVMLALALVALISVSVIPAYSSSYSGTSPIRSPRIDPQGLSVTADVTPVLDTARAVTAVISTAGGSMSVTADDGTLFTLTLPADALISDAEITMTPVSSVDRLPLSGGLVAAVQIEPEGLRLWQPGTLLIVPPAPISAIEESPFAWGKMGEDFHLYPLQLDPSSLEMKLVHFSTYGIGRGTDADREAQQLREPINPEAGLEQRLQAALSEIRLHPTSNTMGVLTITEAQLSALQCSSKLAKATVSVFLKDYKNGIKPYMKSALKSKDDAQLRCALSRALGWKEQVISLGFEGCLAAQIQAVDDFMAKAINIQLDNAFDRCMREHQSQDALLIMSLIGQADRLGVVVNNKERLKQCLKFELNFDSRTTTPSNQLVAHVHAKIAIQYEFTPVTTGEGTLVYDQFTWNECAPGCSCTTSKKDGTLVVLFVFDLNMHDEGLHCFGGEFPPRSPVSATPIIVMSTYTLPPPLETVTQSCLGVVTPYEGSRWTAIFGAYHHEELTGDGFEIRNWKASSGDSFGIKEYLGCQEFACDNSSFDLKLAH